MIKIIEGAKGTGKTKKIIDLSTEVLGTCKGDVVFLSTTTRYRQEIKPQIKFVDAKEVGVCGKEMLFGFIKGMLAANYDVEYIFIDGVYKIMGVDIDSPEMAELFMLLDKLTEANHVNFVLTVSCAKEELPAFIAKYIA